MKIVISTSILFRFVSITDVGAQLFKSFIERFRESSQWNWQTMFVRSSIKLIVKTSRISRNIRQSQQCLIPKKDKPKIMTFTFAILRVHDRSEFSWTIYFFHRNKIRPAVDGRSLAGGTSFPTWAVMLVIIYVYYKTFFFFWLQK